MLNLCFMTYTTKVEHPKAVPQFSACMTVTVPAQAGQRAWMLGHLVLCIWLYLEKLHPALADRQEGSCALPWLHGPHLLC